MFRLFASIVIVLALALPSVSCSKSSPTGPSDPAPAPAVFRFNTALYERDPSVDILYPQNLNAMGNKLVIYRKKTENVINDWPWQPILECERVQMNIEDLRKYSCGIQHIQFTPGEYAAYFEDWALAGKANRIISIDGYVFNRFTRWPTQFVTYDLAIGTLTADGKWQ